MNQATRNKILKYIYDRYTAQEVIQVLIKEFPKSIKRQSVVPKKEILRCLYCNGLQKGHTKSKCGFFFTPKINKHNPYHYAIHLTKLTYLEAWKIRGYLYDNGYEEDDFEYDINYY